MNDTIDHAGALHGADLFLEAAWTHARTFLREKGFVPDVMILGRYQDEELLFVFPSGQDREMFAKSCIAEAASFGADIAMMAREGTMSVGTMNADVVSVYWREAGQPIRSQFAALHRSEGGVAPHLGPVSSMAGEQHEDFLAVIFPEARQ